jgi:hypothetical protein
MPSNESDHGPSVTLSDEGGDTTAWLASAYGKADVMEEWDWKFEDGEVLDEVWYLAIRTTPEQRSDEDWLYEQFGTSDTTECDFTYLYRRVAPETPGAHRYWTTEP